MASVKLQKMRNARFRIAGLALTWLGLVVLGFHWVVMSATGVVSYTGMLLYCFPIVGLLWAWPPEVGGLSLCLLIVCLAVHWTVIGWALDRLVSTRDATPLASHVADEDDC